jgi:hypothetical protein
MAVENKSRRLHAPGLQTMHFHSLTLTLLCIVYIQIVHTVVFPKYLAGIHIQTQHIIH